MHPLGMVQKQRHLPPFVTYLGDGFKYHKIIAFPILIGFILITGTVTTLALRGGGGGEKLTVSDTSQQDSDGTSTRDDSGSDAETAAEATGNDDEIALSDEELANAEFDPDLDLFTDEDEDFFYEPDEPIDLDGPIEEPPVPTDPPGTTPPPIPDTPPTPPNDQPTPQVLTSLASFNYASWKPSTGIAAAVQALSSKAEVVGLQEFGPSEHRDALSKVVRECTACNYSLYMPSPASGGSLPIIWKKDVFQLLSKGNVKAYDAQSVENGAGGTTTPAKFITWVRLKHKPSGRVFFFANTQLIASVEKNGAPDRSMPKRLTLYEKHLSLLANKITQFKENNTPVFVSGDFNVDYRGDRQVKNAAFPYAKMDSVNTWANWRYLGTPVGGTQGTRLIDYVFAARNTKVVPKSAQILPAYGSDHHAVRMVVELK